MDIDNDVAFQRRVWVAQRIGWSVIGILIVIAALGYFGGGPFSRSSAQGGGMTIEYERFARLRQPTKLRFVLDSAPGGGALAVSRAYFDSVQIEQITPKPSAVRSGGEWLVYSFAGPLPAAVTFHLRPDQFGPVSGSARLAAGEAVPFRQFVYP
jgi:hypothetical protein